MREFVLVKFFVALSFFTPNAVYGQDANVSNASSAALSGVKSEVGVTYGGVSITSVALTAVVITSLIAFTLQDSNAVTESAAATE